MNQQTASLLAELLEAAAESGDERAYWTRALSTLGSRYQVETAVLATLIRGQWRRETSSGAVQVLPWDLFAESLDREEVLVHDGWVVAPLSRSLDRSNLVTSVLAVHVAAARAASLKSDMAAAAGWFAACWRLVRDSGLQRQRIERLEAMLGMTAQWGQTPEMDKLLEQIAEASTRLLQAERASVFLWDRDTRTLVGRPALGVVSGELRIPDDAGVVGQVVRSGEPRRVDRESGQQEIDRRVDKQLGFQTRTLLCVPLIGREGQLFGAFELINKRTGNFTDDDQAALIELSAHAARLLENTRQYEHLLESRNQIADAAAAGVQWIGQCASIQALRSTVARVADTELAVLILGENGTGKEVVARSIHYLSRRKREPFIAVNCAALTETLLESELFGHEKGAFTDAHERRSGKFELASGGTLFLDEIGDMSLGGQSKLLRVLEEKIVVRVGGSTPIHTNARVLAATNQKLVELVRQKKFREDLYFRLNVVSLELPPLRDRGDDILTLAERFLHEFARQARRKPPRLTAAAKKRLLGHAWPGNVRELRNLMERMVYLSEDDKVDADELAFIMSPRSDDSAWLPADLTLAEATRQFQVQFIQRQVQRAHGNMTEAAERLGLQRANLYRKMHQLDMETP
jgi:Nif-specific regulatory protein